MRRIPDEDLLEEADLDAAVQLHIDVRAHLVNTRELFRPESGERHTASAVCVTCREVIGESTFAASVGHRIDLDDINWSEHELYLLEHEYGVH